ncbi:MAG: hypothetical protein Q9177_001587 [Variospora cf. flavescens]
MSESNNDIEIAESFDYIIIGAGTAGLVVANRLTTDPHVSALVLEAGADRLDDPKITTPGLLTLTYDDPQYDWSFDTVPQLYGKSVSHSRGKVIGGSSAINALALIYPPKSSIDAWERLGNEGWNWDAMAPYYRKFHTFNPPSKETAEALGTAYIDQEIQGNSGPIQSSFPEFHGPLGKAWPQTFKNLDFPLTSDPLSSGGQATGGFSYLSTVDPHTWERSHAGSAYYTPIKDRPNLCLLTETQVQKIILEKQSATNVVAKGVSFLDHGGMSRTKMAKREVIVCAGAIHSPQLLELSGIGSAHILRSHGTEVFYNNPYVGENFQDHPMTGMSFEVIDGLPTIDMIRDPQVIQGATEAYQTSRQGPLTAGFHSVASLPVVEFLTEEGQAELGKLLDQYVELPFTTPTADHPSLSTQYTILRSLLESPSEGSIIIGMGASQMHFDKSLQKDIYAITEPENYVSFLVALAQPFSRGSVHVKSASISDAPEIDPRYLSHPLDIEILARHMQYIPKIAATEPLASLLKSGGRRLPDGIDLGSLDSAKEHCKRNLITNNHPCGTCAMMPFEDGGVVDSRLRVHGVKGLRVVDASVFPMIPRGNIQSSVYAVAEKASDLIMEDWQGHSSVAA